MKVIILQALIIYLKELDSTKLIQFRYSDEKGDIK